MPSLVLKVFAMHERYQIIFLSKFQPASTDQASSEHFRRSAFTSQLGNLHCAEYRDSGRVFLQISEEDYKELWNHEVPIDVPPWEDQEIEGVQPAPMWPEEIQGQYDRFQWVLYLLRKAYMQPSPASAASHLIEAGTIAHFQYSYLTIALLYFPFPITTQLTAL